MKETNEEPETEVQVRESAKEPTADTKLIEDESSEEKETDKVVNEAKEEEQKIVKELEEETPVSG